MIRLALCALLLAAGAARAQSLADMYPEDVLAADRPRFEQRLGQIYQHGLWGFLDGPEKQALADIALRFPLVGAHGHGVCPRFILGSVSSAVATHAPCSVEIVRTGSAHQIVPAGAKAATTKR